MAYDRSHAESYFPPRFRVAGHELVDMQMGHALLLTALGTPLIQLGEEDTPFEITEADVAQFVFILSRPWRKAADEMKLAGWMYRRRMTKIHSAVVVTGLSRAIIEATKFKDFHLREFPETQKAERVERDSAAPTWGFLISRFMSWGWSKEQVLDESIRVLRWESVCEGDSKGTIIIVNPEETKAHRDAVRKEIARQAMEQMRERVAKGN